MWTYSKLTKINTKRGWTIISIITVEPEFT